MDNEGNITSSEKAIIDGLDVYDIALIIHKYFRIEGVIMICCTCKKYGLQMGAFSPFIYCICKETNKKYIHIYTSLIPENDNDPKYYIIQTSDGSEIDLGAQKNKFDLSHREIYYFKETHLNDISFDHCTICDKLCLEDEEHYNRYANCHLCENHIPSCCQEKQRITWDTMEEKEQLIKTGMLSNDHPKYTYICMNCRNVPKPAKTTTDQHLDI